MKTILIFDQVCENPISFLVVNGDYSHLSNVYVNNMNVEESLQDELCSLIYTEDWELVDGFTETFPTEHVQKDTKVIVVGFLP